MASRQVITPAETFVQGFVVDGAGLAHWMFEREFPAELLPGEPRGETEARLPILGAAWRIRGRPPPAHRAGRRPGPPCWPGSSTSRTSGARWARCWPGVCLLVLVRRSERLAEERSRFAAAAAHELRTPLAGIRLHGEMLALALGNPARVTEYAGRITDEAERLTRLVSNVFNYTQVDQKLLRIQKARADLGQVVREALTLVEPIVERAGGSLMVRLEEGLPPASVDKDAVHQMVRNLVDNAEKYTRQSRRPPHRGVGQQRRPDAVVIAVRDHGPGVPATARGRIFAPFERHDDAATSPAGWAWAWRWCARWRWPTAATVSYEEPTGGGARFVVRLPV